MSEAERAIMAAIIDHAVNLARRLLGEGVYAPGWDDLTEGQRIRFVVSFMGQAAHELGYGRFPG